MPLPVSSTPASSPGAGGGSRRGSPIGSDGSAVTAAGAVVVPPVDAGGTVAAGAVCDVVAGARPALVVADAGGQRRPADDDHRDGRHGQRRPQASHASSFASVSNAAIGASRAASTITMPLSTTTAT